MEAAMLCASGGLEVPEKIFTKINESVRACQHCNNRNPLRKRNMPLPANLGENSDSLGSFGESACVAIMFMRNKSRSLRSAPIAQLDRASERIENRLFAIFIIGHQSPASVTGSTTCAVFVFAMVIFNLLQKGHSV
jgi:hypothetical protein